MRMIRELPVPMRSIASKLFNFKAICLTWERNALESPAGKCTARSVGDRG